jgi:pimeloyl-ACP methyl ester carboxylesterase
VPLLLLPGTLCDGALWEHQVTALADLTAPAVVDLTGDDSIAGLAQDALEAAPPRFLLAGLSMGGIVAFELMRRSPERVLGLALLDTTPAPPDGGQVEGWREEIDMIERGLFPAIVEERWMPLLLSASGSRGVRLGPVIRRMAMNVGAESYRRQLHAQIGRRESWSLLPSIRCPTLVLGGRQDALCPPALQERMAASIPNARLAIVEDCGHLSPLERPEQVTSLLRGWVGETRAAGGAAAGRAHA